MTKQCSDFIPLQVLIGTTHVCQANALTTVLARSRELGQANALTGSTTHINLSNSNSVHSHFNYKCVLTLDRYSVSSLSPCVNSFESRTVSVMHHSYNHDLVDLVYSWQFNLRNGGEKDIDRKREKERRVIPHSRFLTNAFSFSKKLFYKAPVTDLLTGVC